MSDVYSCGHSGAKWAAYVSLTLYALLTCALAQEQEPEVMATPPPRERCRSEGVFSCYECRTSSGQPDPFCGDPFNTSHPELKVIQCEHFCTKWVVQLRAGDIQTTRTCSNQLELNMRIYTVCMRESASADGHLCFCEGELCNAAPSWTTVASQAWACSLSVFLVALLSTFLTQQPSWQIS